MLREVAVLLTLREGEEAPPEGQGENEAAVFCAQTEMRPCAEIARPTVPGPCGYLG